ncbi:GNAT family N-acetyltransferase [Lentzea jiangxiensis]|uniref:Protein N-acetyltransferase, RimJ/RimL family n=1 Tax=Lentzea jiangxiensis TaxID=641025 RepID=A0A1H0X509_9PSEU|nr:GNAT family N-acetyltransferase [Lentzea jiangxiensis]SDP97556.1 Protein N-acetyltransferase, RimJ/RimL family [Lentzea jiangxiensis]
MSPSFPETTLRTGRLVLRPFTAEDAEDVQHACADEAAQRWLPIPSPYTMDDAIGWCTVRAHALRESGDGIHFAVTDVQTGKLVANVGLRETDWESLTSEIGYWVSPWARDRGYAVDAVSAVTEWLFDEHRFQRLELRAADGNTASQRVAVKAGFHREGVLRNAGVTHGGRVDIVLYSRVPDDRKGKIKS